MPNHDEYGEFVGAMTLYRKDAVVFAVLRLPEDDEERVVEVPPHMAQMLPQAIYMIQSQAEDGE